MTTKRIRCGKIFVRKSDAARQEPTDNETATGTKVARLFEIAGPDGQNYFVWSWNSGSALASVARHCGFACTSEGKRRGRKPLPELPPEEPEKPKKSKSKKRKAKPDRIAEATASIKNIKRKEKTKATTTTTEPSEATESSATAPE